MSLISESLRKERRLKSEEGKTEAKNKTPHYILSESVINSIISKKKSLFQKQWIAPQILYILGIISIFFLILGIFLFKKSSSIKKHRGYTASLNIKTQSQTPISITNAQSSLTGSEVSIQKSLLSEKKDLEQAQNPYQTQNYQVNQRENKDQLQPPLDINHVDQKNATVLSNKAKTHSDIISKDPNLAASNKTEKNISDQKTAVPVPKNPQSFFKWEVIKETESTLTGQPQDKFSAEDYNNQAVACYYRGELKEAIEKLKTAIQINPNNFESYVNLGIVYKKQNNFNYAFIAYKKAISLKPASPDPYYNIGILYDEMGLLWNVVEAYQKFLELAPDENIYLKQKVKERIKKIKSQHRAMY